jgi:hypothetical protein
MIRPHLPALLRRKYVDAGYLVAAPTVRALAAAIGVDPEGLEQTVAATKPLRAHGCRRGVRQGHQRVRPPVRRSGPHPQRQPRPDRAAAVLRDRGGADAARYGARAAADPTARVLDAASAPIPGLYACGNDANPVMAAEYPGAGCQVGAALTFGHVAARHATGRPL